MRPVPPALSRALLTPGPLPPLSHLGVTLLRHAVATGLRYALYQLGLPVPEAPPVRIVRLRLYLDAAKLERLLHPEPGGMEVLSALLDPGGLDEVGPAPSRLAAAVAFHRLRLRLSRHPASRLSSPAPAERLGSDTLWGRFQQDLSRHLRRTNEALLADLLASLDRRRHRARGEETPPVCSRASVRLLAGHHSPLDRFGVPDLREPSWADRPDVAELVERARREPAILAATAGDPWRGRFRETYRATLTRLVPLYRQLARGAVARGYLGEEEEAFFLPLDLAGDLAAPAEPHWLEDGVRGNRAEHDSLRQAPEPPDLLRTGLEVADPGDAARWDLTPLLPLP